MTIERSRNDSLWIGLMTGTSLDGVDAVLARLTPGVEILSAVTMPLPADMAERILAVGPDTSLRTAMRLDSELAILYAAAVETVLKDAGVETAAVSAIGCHGQTVWHAPDQDPPVTVQLGDPNQLAERTGITVVADFRRRDLAAGGQGAPLAPAFHHALFAHPDETRVVVNIGGMANLTLLPPSGQNAIAGFDTGPGNVLLDTWIDHCRGLPFDDNGSWAASGNVIEALLARMLDEPYFRQLPPKSTGRETFSRRWLDAALVNHGDAAPADIQATLAELTAVTIAADIKRHAPACERVLLSGGGAVNAHLRSRIAAALPGIPVEPTDAYGVAAGWVEAVGFAWLAGETLAGRCSNIPAVTGARHPVVLGGIYQGRSAS